MTTDRNCGCVAHYQLLSFVLLIPLLEAMYKLPSKDRERVIKGAVLSLLWTQVWFVGNVAVSRLRTECVNVISHRNLDPFNDFQVAQKRRSY